MAQQFPLVANEDEFSAIIRMEQEDYLDRMELPPGTARNAALRENVFVMLVSILNRIPVFVVGKPGCSKSLAIQLIKSNLRGEDSIDPFFKTLPHLYVVSYQGSESSTSEGIEEIFEKASNYKNQDANVLPVVLLDEVGLAENSSNNPLKVLHSILEPGKGELPQVAVVGISNWALDAAKMNRAIHLSRPEPTVKDLEETAISLYHADGERQVDATTRNVLANIADAYHEYQSEQGHRNFHGLRDYYSLVKSLRNGTFDDYKINIALQRNFGGIPVESSKIQEIFMDKFLVGEKYVRIPVATLIQENLDDLKARHLMLITNGDSAIGILKQNFSQSEKETITIFGSRFEEDMSDDYNYRMLSRIILCMERECILILRDLECIYGSLYDMLNQNYSVVGKRKNCRVALGANSNPMCYVNDGFRCIVLVDHDKVDFSDPPFLNRFEKQLLRFSDVLNEDQQEIIEELESWVEQMSCVEDLDEQFKKSDMFMGFHEDTLPSLVLLHSKDTDDCGVILKKCKDDLMWIATTDGVLRAQKCEFMQENPQELKMLVEDYFEKPIHHGLSSFIECVVRDQQLTYTRESEFGSKTVVMTYATVHSDISKYLDPTIATYQLERLGSYKSEKQLEDRIHNFFSSDKDLLVFQCKPELDDKHMLLARSIIEDKRKSYVEEYQESNSMKRRKHVCIIVHVRRVVREETTGWQFNFLSGWKQVFLDALDVPSIGVSEMRNESIENLFSSSVWSFQGFAAKCILWCFNCIKYSQSERRRETILKIAKNLFASEKVTTAIQKLVLRNVDSIDDDTFEETWQVKVACDIELLLNSSTVSSAMEQYLSFLIRQPLAKIVYFLERENAWPPHVLSTHEDTIDYEDIWCDLLLNSTILNIVEIPESHGAETYFVDGVHLNLRVPFSQVIFHDADSARGPIMKEYAKAMRNESNFDDSDRLKADARLEHLRQYSKILRKLAPCIHVVSKNCMSSYMADVFELLSADFYSKINSQQCISFCMCAFLSFAKQWLPIEDNDPHQFYALLHLFAWTSSDEINCLLELVDSCCQELMQPKYLEKMTREFFLENHHVLPFSETDPIDERFDVLRTKTKSSGREYKDRESNDYDSSDSDSSDSDDSDSSDSDDSEDEEDDDDEEEEDCFEDILVTEICEKLFPSKRTVEKNGGLDLWIENSSHLLSLASKVSNETPPAYHFLRLCVDYAEMVVQESGKCEDYLYVLNTIGRELEPEYLDDESSFQKIKEKVIDPVENYLMGEEENHAILQIFLAQFYNRFPEANAETKSARAIIEHVLSLRGEEVLIMTSVIYRLLFAEEDRSSGIFIDIILDQKVGEKQSNLKDIDEVFKERFAVGQIHHDSYPAVMICDLIHFIQNFDKYFNIKQLASSDSKLLRCFRSATNFVTGSDDNIGLVLLSSVAFLRAFYSMLSKNRSILTGETPYSHVMNEINSLLAGGGARRSSLQIFFLKQLYRDNMTMFDLRKLCFESVNLPVIRNQMEQCKIVNKVELVSVFRLDEYEEVKAAFSLLTQKNEEEMSNVMKKCEKSANHRLALLGILINEFFVKKAVGNLSDKEEHLANWFRKNSKDLPSVMKELLVRIVGHKSFRHQGLQISLESSTYEIDIALLILHVSCVVASHDEGENSPLVQYFSNPKNCHVLAQGEDRKRRVFQQFTLCNESTESKEWEECTVNMSASVYRALDMIVYACFYAGIATGISSSEDVLPLLPANKQGSPSRATCKDSADFCFNRVKDDLRCLQTILSCDSRTAVDVMHLVVEECTELIRGKTSSDGNFGTRRECIEWENRFTNVAEEILPKALGSARQLKETRMDFEGEKRSLIEKQIMELDEYPSDHEQQNEELKRLFRVTKQPSFTELRSIYLNRFNDFQEHRVLAVLLSKFHELPYLACLYPLIRWSRLVSSKLTNRISRKEAQSKVIYDFIDGRLLRQEESNDEGTELREIFNDFKVAWNKVREFVNQNIDPDQEEMPYLTEESYIGYCLTEGDFSIYLQTAIKILQSIQNNILDEITLASARTRHAARLRLLKKNKNRNAITSVSLQEAKEKDIIKFNWSDEFLKYVQDPNYGLGEDTDYDFDKIEEELVIEIVAGKCHLTESVNTFIFAKELFHSSAKVLTKIREFCPQSQSLPEEICQGLNSLKESRKQDARTLLQHIEIVIYLLNIESIPADDIKKITLVKFVEMWETKLPSPFPIDLLPEPKASIQLTHIAALYEALEDLLADGAIEGLPRQYNVKLTKDTEKILNSLVDNRNKSLKLKLFLKALRRFVFRYLSAEKFLPESHTPLRSCLMEPSLWSPEEAPSADVIPGELRLENIYAIMKHLDQELKEHSSARLNQESRETGLGIRRRPKRRVIAKFSR
ncbi:uncharacterized protein LOC114536257 [Dendronephthya gigantea]|uniref:uncharacterized protein LOC114536257 n=1 Tax=Dendronephthya gigantea TaxID=151771 RepID=UPI00106C08B7|nr:uncharacterized protein LOC114536257 [Dendronephthya gigantea]